MSPLLRWIAVPVSAGFVIGTLATSALAFSSVGGTSMEEPQGLSLRQESTRSGGGFFLVYSRYHLGGGLGGGK